MVTPLRMTLSERSVIDGPIDEPILLGAVLPELLRRRGIRGGRQTDRWRNGKSESSGRMVDWDGTGSAGWNHRTLT